MVQGDSICGAASNFTSCIQLIENVGETGFCVRINHTKADDWQYHYSLHGRVESITKCKRARNTIQQCDYETRNKLFLMYYEGMGKISGYTREYFQYKNTDLSALALLVGNYTILELEQLCRNNKTVLKELVKKTKLVCEETWIEYTTIYRGIYPNG